MIQLGVTDVAHALVRAVSRLISTQVRVEETRRRQECRRGAHECVRHAVPPRLLPRRPLPRRPLLSRDRKGAVALLAAALLISPPALPANGWSDAVEVRHDSTLCVTYTAKLAGETLVVRAKIEPGWHTFAMDNKVRADEKLAGRKSLGIDRQTDIAISGGLAVAGAWKQSAPVDFSKPELRWFTFGFEKEAYFAAKVGRRGAGPARIGIRGQACTDAICKNIDVEVALPAGGGNAAGEAGVDLRSLVEVRAAGAGSR